MKRLARFFCLAGTILFGVTGLFAAAGAEDGFLIVEVWAAGKRIDLGAVVMYQGGEVYLPAEFLSAELELALQTDAKGDLSGKVNGKSILVSPRANEARAGDVFIEPSADDFANIEGVWYYKAGLLARLLDLQFDFDYAEQRLSVSSGADPLPLEERTGREHRLRAFDAQRQEEEFPPVERNDFLFQPPFFDLAARYNVSKDENGNKTGFLGYSANAFAVTGGFDTEAYVYDMNQHSPATVALKTSRYQPDGKMLGLFKRVEAGDILSFSNPAVNYAQAGRGIKFSSTAQDFAESKTFNIRDTLPLGWEVELYRGDELMGYQRAGTDGFFEFRDIALLLGENVFRLVFYGPQGQRKERVIRYFFTGGLVDKGVWDVQAGFIEKNKYLIETRKDVPSYQQGYNGQLTAAYGVSENLTLNAGVLYGSVAEFTQNGFERLDKLYGTAGAAYSFAGMFVNVQSVYDTRESAASADVSWQTRWKGWDVLAQNVYYDGVVTERNILSDDKIKNDTSLRINKTLASGRFSLPVNYMFRRFITAQGDQQIEHSAGLYKTVWRGWYAALAYQYISGLNHTHWNLLNIDVNKAAVGYSLRANASYDFIHNRWRETGVSAYKDLTPRLNAGLSYRRLSREELGHSYENRYGGSLNWKTKYGYWSVDAGWSQTHAYYAYIGVNLSFLYDPFTKSAHSSPDKLYGTGAFSVSAFLDENLNGKRDPEEKTLPGAVLDVVPVPVNAEQTVTDENGSARITQVRAYQPHTVRLDLNKTDGTFSVAKENVLRRVEVRPGQVMRLEYPVYGTGDVEGTVFLRRPGAEDQPLSGMLLKLTDEKSGKVLATHISEFDGYYLFETLPFGRYRLEPDSRQMEELGFLPPPAETVEVDKNEQVTIKNITVSGPGVKNGTDQTGMPSALKAAEAPL